MLRRTGVLGLIYLGADEQPPAQPLRLVSPPPTLARHAMVVSIHHDASDAGVEVLKSGGNAVDAAVAVGFALAVVFPQAGNLGGGGFMLVRMKTGEAHFLDYRERAPAASSAGMYLDAQGNVVAGLSITGYKAIGVPGTVAGLIYAEKTYGRLTLARVMAPAIRLASQGYILSEEEARNLAAAKNLAMFPDSRRIFQRDGNFLKPGDRFTQPELARTLQRIAADPASFYKGPIAAELAASIQKGGGLITTADLAAYQVKDRAPLTGSYRGCQIVTAPPPSAGGIVLLEILNILSGYDLARMGDRSPQQVHLITEAFRRAYKDRADYLGDPDFVTMPVAAVDPRPPTPPPGARPSSPSRRRPRRHSLAPPVSCLRRPPRRAPRRTNPPRPRTSPSSMPRATPSPAPIPLTASSAPASPLAPSASCSTTRWTTSPPHPASPTCTASSRARPMPSRPASVRSPT
jgi:gamma-glutamyltranspeptidase/glutathione hydrolase